MATENILLLIMIVLIAGVFPGWPYSKAWGYAPMRGLTVVLAIFLLWDLSEGRSLFSSSEQSVQNAAENSKLAGSDMEKSFMRFAHR